MSIPEPPAHQEYEAFEGAFRPEVCQRCGGLVADTMRHDKEHYMQDHITMRVVAILSRMGGRV